MLLLLFLSNAHHFSALSSFFSLGGVTVGHGRCLKGEMLATWVAEKRILVQVRSLSLTKLPVGIRHIYYWLHCLFTEDLLDQVSVLMNNKPPLRSQAPLPRIRMRIVVRRLRMPIDGQARITCTFAENN